MLPCRGWSKTPASGLGDCSVLALVAGHLVLFEDQSEGVCIKVRRRGASDCKSLAPGGGSLVAPAVVEHEVTERGFVPV